MARPPTKPKVTFAIALAAHNAELMKAKAAIGLVKLRGGKPPPLITHSVARALGLKAGRKTRRAARVKR